MTTLRDIDQRANDAEVTPLDQLIADGGKYAGVAREAKKRIQAGDTAGLRAQFLAYADIEAARKDPRGALLKAVADMVPA